MDNPFQPDTYTLLEDARAIAAFLLVQDPQGRFPFATQARIAYVQQLEPLMLRGEPCDAYIATAKVQGAHRLLWPFLASRFGEPSRFPLDFLIYIDAAAWTRRGWPVEPGASGFPILREALIYHELCHLRQLFTSEGEPRFGEDGRPLLALTRHTYEFFQDEVLRYGPHTLGLSTLTEDLAAGTRTERHRERRGKLRIV